MLISWENQADHPGQLNSSIIMFYLQSSVIIITTRKIIMGSHGFTPQVVLFSEIDGLLEKI